MKSKIWLDIDRAGQPLIKITHYDSDDIKDKLLNMFLEKAKVYYNKKNNQHEFSLKLTSTGGGKDEKGSHSDFEIYPDQFRLTTEKESLDEELDKELFYNDNERRNGKSTRLVDYYIQQLFKDGEILIRDHLNNFKSHKTLFDKILRRLKNEHPHISFEICNPSSLILKIKTK